MPFFEGVCSQLAGCHELDVTMVGDTPLSCFVFGNSKITVPFSSISIIKQYFRKVKKDGKVKTNP